MPGFARPTAGTPCLRSLGRAQGAVAESKEAGGGCREQAGTGQRRHQAAASDDGKEPEPQRTEESDEHPNEDGQCAPGTFAAIAVVVQGDFAASKDG